MGRLGNLSRKPVLRLFAAAMATFVIGLIGGTIGAGLWPATKQGAERHVIEPVIRVVRSAATTDSLADMVERSCPAVVAIRTSVTDDPAKASGSKSGQATGGGPLLLAGFFVSPDGIVLTRDAGLPSEGTITVLLNDGRQIPATRAAADPVSGLTLLKVEGSGFAVLGFAGPDFPRVGEWGIALSSPNGTGCAAMPAMISSDFIADGGGLWSYVRVRPELADQPSGTPVLDSNGHVLGIGGMNIPGDKGFSTSLLLPAGIASGITSELLRSSTLQQNGFGLEIGDVTPGLAARLGDARQRGAVISLVQVGSPADRAGLLAGDVVLAANGGPVASASELVRILDAGQDRIALQILRGAVKLDVDLEPSGARAKISK